ncbi:hypothetical protein [Paenibacillus tianjinensis]|uniref:Uncharacterized protein n=1 Tax=Paenibacillus tianjinensis TaxID=2810347 RepID=A0ABX7LBB7_9BACL|nr:hypothetical protein [Paenibacillus tianjinensis]QSF43277.1 hypothetical protein JRJ22_18595 [Paenibacillus tianjinensis]
MAIVKQPSVYGVVELNMLQAVNTGGIKVQYPLDATDFASIPAENGMLLVVDDFAGTVKKPTGVTSAVWLHASVEKDYEGKGRKYFAVNRGEFLPRVLQLNVGDTFETNAFEYDNATYATYAAVVAAISSSVVYGVPSTTGYIRIVAAPAGTETVVLKAVKGVTLPNGEKGLKFAVSKA